MYGRAINFAWPDPTRFELPIVLTIRMGKTLVVVVVAVVVVVVVPIGTSCQGWISCEQTYVRNLAVVHVAI